MTWWMILLLCAQIGGQECYPHALPYPLPNRLTCLIMAHKWVREQPHAPHGYRWRMPMNNELACADERPSLPEIPVYMGGERFV